jgi:hypothetical protein
MKDHRVINKIAVKVTDSTCRLSDVVRCEATRKVADAAWAFEKKTRRGGKAPEITTVADQ